MRQNMLSLVFFSFFSLTEWILPTNVCASIRMQSICSRATWTIQSNEDIKFSKECFQKQMNISLHGVKVGDFDLRVQFSPVAYDNCTEYNISKQERDIHLALINGFQNHLNYALRVQAIQDGSILWRHTMNIGSCPFTGSWSSWSSWDSCYCKEPTKMQTRIRQCVENTDQRTKILVLYQCQGEQPIQMQSCYLTCRPFLDETTETTSYPSFKTSSQNLWTNNVGVIFGGLAILCITLVAMVMYYKKSVERRDQSVCSLEGNDDETSVYISHLSREESEEEEEILSLVHYLSSLNLHCCVDLLNQVEINNTGGLPNWIPEHILSVQKILMVISKDYLQNLQDSQGVEENDVQVCKIHAEFSYIKSMLYHSCVKASPKLVLLLERGVQYQDLPNELQGLSYCYYPKRFKLVEDENCRKLVGMLKNTEPLKTVAEFTPRTSYISGPQNIELAETVL